MDRLTDNKVEKFKVSSIEQWLDNHQNVNFHNLPLYCDERLITIRQLYRINDIITYSYINSSILYVLKN